MSAPESQRERILVIDDEASVRNAYLSSLSPTKTGSAAMDALDAALFGGGKHEPLSAAPEFEVDTAQQGEEGLAKVKRALSDGRPYGMAFVDMRMPPGWDGVETIERLWEADPGLEVVVCTAYSDKPWEEVARRLGQTHRLLLLRKPFDVAEVSQLAYSLARKRRAERESESARAVLEATNQRLSSEMDARRTAENQLRFDSLTSLPNRVLLQERIERCIERAKNDPAYGYAVLFVDLDDFKLVNDRLGHAVGDSLLIEVGNRLRACVRAEDPAIRDTHIPARLGGDEFVVLIDGVSSAEGVSAIAKRIQMELGRPLRVAGHELATQCSIGFVVANAHADIPEDVLRDADAALYQAKSEGKGRVRGFDDSIRERVIAQRKLAADLKHAASGGQLRLVYQPIYVLESGVIDSFEALLRWQHPELGQVSPAKFIPVAEESGSIGELGTWALREACQQLRIWHDRFAEMRELSIAVNVSYWQLVDPALPDIVKTILSEVGLEGRFLHVEITESAFIENLQAVREHLVAIRSLGVKLHLDDFGTGYSSLSAFHELPIDAVKIDRSFVSAMNLKGTTTNIVQAIQTMASNRSLRVIAEGIENAEQLSQLQALDCTCGQGYYFSRPVDAGVAQELIQRRTVPRSEERAVA
jgi:diguanylate cyclase (GGDEF)-like protein